MGDTVQEVDCDLTKEQVAELKQAFDMFDRLVFLLQLELKVRQIISVHPSLQSI